MLSQLTIAAALALTPMQVSGINKGLAPICHEEHKQEMVSGRFVTVVQEVCQDSGQHGSTRTGTREAGADSSVPYKYKCETWIIMTPAPPPKFSGWEGNSAKDGDVAFCTRSKIDGGVETIYRFVGKGQPAPAGESGTVVVDAEQVAREAMSELDPPDPTVRLGPDPDHISVNAWTWLWVDDPVQIDPAAFQATATAGSVSVTARARIRSVSWSMGEPIRPGESGTTAPVECAGAGLPAPDDLDIAQRPDCGYRYRWKSTKVRTNGVGKWPVTATVTWQFDWDATTGESGTLRAPRTGSARFAVGEWRSVLICGSSAC